MSGMSDWVVTLDGSRPVAEVRDDLARAGFQGMQSLEAIGVITGRADAAAAQKARTLRGVGDVAGDTPVDIGPPGRDPTW